MMGKKSDVRWLRRQKKTEKDGPRKDTPMVFCFVSISDATLVINFSAAPSTFPFNQTANRSKTTTHENEHRTIFHLLNRIHRR